MDLPVPSTKHVSVGMSRLALNGEATRRAGDGPNECNPSVHPLADAVAKRQVCGLQHQLDTMTKTPFGRPLAFAKYMEYKLAAQVGRGAGLPSSNVMLDTLTGDDETINIEDYIGSQDQSETAVHARTQIDAAANKQDMNRFL